VKPEEGPLTSSSSADGEEKGRKKGPIAFFSHGKRMFVLVLYPPREEKGSPPTRGKETTAGRRSWEKEEKKNPP